MLQQPPIFPLSEICLTEGLEYVVHKQWSSAQFISSQRPALVAHLDARPTGDKEVAGSTPAGSAIFFRGD